MDACAVRVTPDASGMPIALRDVGVRTRNARLLRDVTMTVLPAARLVVIGPNGAGKSTLLRVLHGLVAPSEGIVTWGDSMIPSHQAMVFQRPVLLRRSVAGNVDYALRVSGVPRASRAARVEAALARAGLLDHARRQARTLSGGEQQRLAVARAAAREPEVLFLDEPTSSLDPAATRAVEAMVEDIHADGTAIVMSTHNLAQARRLGGEVVFVHAGRVTEVTESAAFFRAPRSVEAAQFLDAERL